MMKEKKSPNRDHFPELKGTTLQVERDELAPHQDLGCKGAELTFRENLRVDEEGEAVQESG